MGHPLRVEFPGAWYHVMNRGAGRRRIFHEDQDRRLFLDLLSEVTQTFHIEIHAFSLMENHYHLLVHTPDSGLGRAMRHLNGIYTYRFNRRHGTDGPLFRGRYKARLVDQEGYLLELARYIHLNPVRAGLTRSPSDHPWTSHRFYLHGNGRETDWLETREILDRFGKSGRQARRGFDRFVREGVPEWFDKEWRKGGFALGTQGFKEWVYQNFEEWTRRDEEIPQRERKPKRIGSIKAILDHVAFAYNLNVRGLRKRGDRKRNDARSMAIYLARRLTGIPQRDLARWMAASSPYTIAKVQQRFRERINRDQQLMKLTHQVEKQIWSNVKT